MPHGNAGQLSHRQQQRYQADGNVDVEYRSPHERVGKPSAQNWTKHRGDHNAKAENGESLAMLLTGKGIEQNSLTQGNERCTA